MEVWGVLHCSDFAGWRPDCQFMHGYTVGFPLSCTTLLALTEEGAEGPVATFGLLGATNLADGAHGPHVALISRAEFR